MKPDYPPKKDPEVINKDIDVLEYEEKEKKELYKSVPDTKSVAEDVKHSLDIDSTLDVTEKEEKLAREEHRKISLKEKLMRSFGSAEAWKSATLDELKEKAKPALNRQPRAKFRQETLEKLEAESEDKAKAYLIAIGVKNWEMPGLDSYDSKNKLYTKNLEIVGPYGQ